jgi:UDP-N-acetylglucosamine 2-epimerase (non-hydrolysing)
MTRIGYSRSRRVFVVCGTRPETIKLAPVIGALRQGGFFDVRLCATGQHREMLDQVMTLFGLIPDVDLNIMRPGQDLYDTTSHVLNGLRDVLRSFTPGCVVVQGDTTTAFAASLAAFYEKIPVAHVEAGLRTGDRYAPWPEEMNRKLTSVIASLHFAPTNRARQSLLDEGVPSQQIHVTGNTVVDALLGVTRRMAADKHLLESAASRFPFLDPRKKLVLITGHRRENFGAGFENICRAIERLGRRNDIQLVYPVHLNPNVQEPVLRVLGKATNVHLLPPLEYLPFVFLMQRSFIILTDSGGVQEEAPTLGKPVLVMREVTERPEAVEAGSARLVGTLADGIVLEVERLFEDRSAYAHVAGRESVWRRQGFGADCQHHAGLLL